MSAYAPTFDGSFGLFFEAAAYWSIAFVLWMLRPRAFGIVGTSDSAFGVNERILGMACCCRSADEEAESLRDCRRQQTGLGFSEPDAYPVDCCCSADAEAESLRDCRQQQFDRFT